MDYEYSCACTTRDGKLKLFNVEAFNRAMFNIPDGLELALTVKEVSHAKQRSLRALGYYFGVVLAMAEKETGQPAEDIHAAMVERFVPLESKRVEFYNQMTGERLPVQVEQRHSPKEGNKFYDFVEEVRQFLREFIQLDTPDPDPEYWRKRASKAA